MRIYSRQKESFDNSDYCVYLGATGVRNKILALIARAGVTVKLMKLMGYAVAQLIEALRYKPEGRGFNSRCVIRIFH
jgi:hypothetical protein